MATGERPKRNCALKRAAGTRSVSHLAKTLTGCAICFGIADSDREAALSCQERRDGPAVKQLALPTVLASEERGTVARATGENVLDIKNLWPIARTRIPNVEPLV